jgi:hypothetical protein
MPPSQFVCIERLSGVGKTFVINIIWNMTHIIHNTNRANLASAPTECPAALIDSITHCWAAAILTGERFYKAPKNVDTNNAEKTEWWG